MRVSSVRLATVQRDLRGDLIRVGGAVAKHDLDLRMGEHRFRKQRLDTVAFGLQIVEPHRYLPHVRPTDQPGASSCGSITERDQRVLVAAGAFLSVAAESIRESLARGPRPQPDPLGETVIEADRNVYGHAYNVARCPQRARGRGPRQDSAAPDSGPRRRS